MSEPPRRRAYLDWLRGVAVLIMIEAHVIDAWTRAADRSSRPYWYSILLAGFAAPLFLFLAGLSAVLSAESKRCRPGGDAQAAAAVRRRGWEILGLAFLFRLQAIVVSWGALRGFLKVDILNIMGPAIVATAAIWQLARTRAARLVAFAAATTTIAMLTPVVYSAAWLAPLPDPLEWYVRSSPGRTSFAIFPWMAFPLAGAIVGLLVDAARERHQERRLMAGLAIGGAALAFAAWRLSFLPSLYRDSNFWTSSPAFFFLRVGVMTAFVPIAWRWGRWSPIEAFGRSSLFVYWIHVEMVYGLVSLPLHRRLPLAGAWIALGLFILLQYRLVRFKNRVVARRRARRSAGPGIVVDAGAGQAHP